MEEVRTKGIVIDSQDYKEYDKIITFFTYDLGVIKAVVKGVKKPTAKSRFAGQLFCFVDLILSKRGDYYTVISCDLIESFFEIAYKYDKFMLAVDIVKVIKFIARYNPESTELFVIFISILNVIIRLNADNNIVYLKFLLMTLKVLGFEHDYMHCDRCRKQIKEKGCVDRITGGIVCKQCVSREYYDLSEENLKTIKLVANTEYADLESIKLETLESLDILQKIQVLFKIDCNNN